MAYGRAARVRSVVLRGSALTALAATLGLPAVALAQDAPPEAVPDIATPQPASGDGVIVVTGSRVVTDGFSAPTPVTVLSGEDLLTTTPSTIGEGLNKLPSSPTRCARPAPSSDRKAARPRSSTCARSVRSAA